jgi:CheY-like chemotaxis protein
VLSAELIGFANVSDEPPAKSRPTALAAVPLGGTVTISDPESPPSLKLPGVIRTWFVKVAVPRPPPQALPYLTPIVTLTAATTPVVSTVVRPLSQLSHGVDLVLLDLVMPRAQVDGFVFLSEVRSRPDLANTPVMILSGLGSAVTEAMDPAIASKLRIVSVVTKPVVITDLLRQVREILEPAAAADPASSPPQ